MLLGFGVFDEWSLSEFLKTGSEMVLCGSFRTFVG